MGGLLLKMAYRAFEGLLGGISNSEVGYLTYAQYYAPALWVNIGRGTLKPTN